VPIFAEEALSTHHFWLLLSGKDFEFTTGQRACTGRRSDADAQKKKSRGGCASVLHVFFYPRRDGD